MAITLSDDAVKTLHASIKRYVAENFDEEIGYWTPASTTRQGKSRS